MAQSEHLPGAVWTRRSRLLENTLLALVLAGLILLPLAEIILRAAFQTGISSAPSLVQHLTFLVGILGGALAARENRLLALSSLPLFLKGKWKTAAAVWNFSAGAAISLVLAWAGAQFALSERAGQKVVAYGIPVWWVLGILPVGFVLVAWRLIQHAGDSWKIKGTAAGLMVLWLAAAIGLVSTLKWTWAGLVLLGIAALAGLPIYAVLGGLTLVLMAAGELPIAAIPLKHYSLVTNPSLPTIPLFTLAGYFLAEGGASRRLVAVFTEWFGRFRGGPVLMTILVCAFFTTFTGASGVTILALGGLLLPVLLAARYRERDALGLLTGAGSLGVLFPPCLPLILYAILASTALAHAGIDTGSYAEITMEKMFLGGIGPGVLMLVMMFWLGLRMAPPTPPQLPPFQWRQALRATWIAKWELVLPFVALGALFSGFATPVEAAAVTAFYAFIIETVVYRDLKFPGQTIRVLAEGGLLVGGVLLILGVAMGLTNYLVVQDVPGRMAEWVRESIQSRWLFLLLLNFFLLAVGCLMDMYSALVVVVPLIVPMGLAYGIDPIHLGVIFLANLQLGFLTPPIGMNLFLASYRFGKSITEIIRATWPCIVVFAIAVLVITYFPPLTTLLPQLIDKF